MSFTTKRAGNYRPFFLVDRFLNPTISRLFVDVSLQQTVEQTVTGLGYDLVEIERSAGGLLRITIDWPWLPDAPAQMINVEDCERVTRQLQFALEVDGAEYNRLEVSSPGIDRPLRHVADFERFVGEEIDLTLKVPMGVAAAGQVSANRKKFRGVLERTDDGQGWQITWRDAVNAKPGQKISKKRAETPLHALGFTLDELREARLAPIVDFKGRQPR
ncbi:rimP Ribosome maturation factor RimP [Burkholderiaceae bacterium]